jgi:Na+-driven multidrug efflux pump
MSWRPDWSLLGSLFGLGLPAAIQGVVMNVAGVIMLRFIGSLAHSAEAQASYAVCYAELFAITTLTSNGLMGAAACIVGQNLGARRPDRSVQAVHVASAMGVGVAVAMGVLFLAAPDQLLSVFGLTDPIVLQTGRTLLAYLTVSGLFVTVALTYTGGLQGMADTRSPLVISLFSQVVVPLGYCAAMQSLGELRPGDVWLAIVLGHGCRCVLSVFRFRQRNRGVLAHARSVDYVPRGGVPIEQTGTIITDSN